MFYCETCNIISFDIHIKSHQQEKHNIKDLGVKPIGVKNSVGKNFADYVSKLDIIYLHNKTSKELLEIKELIMMCTFK